MLGRRMIPPLLLLVQVKMVVLRPNRLIPVSLPIQGSDVEMRLICGHACVPVDSLDPNNQAVQFRAAASVESEQMFTAWES